jgi:glycosyltransferase involved in cell wall biosynthesis
MASEISFVIYFHSSRLENLKQCVRFLEKRESNLLSSELVLVCHDHCESFGSKFNTTRLLNLCCKTYNKAQFCNHGVNEASGKIIVLLDSDRILPPDYFSKCISLLKTGQFITTKYLYNLSHPYSDEEIESGKADKVEDFRSVSNAGRSKNLFSGNTVFMKQDYQATGGMDESFVGYGFVDNYQTSNILNCGFEQVYLDDDELHLYHKKEVYWENDRVENFKIMTAINAVKYFRKFRLPIDRESSILIQEVRRSLGSFRADLVDAFNTLDSRKLL